MNQTYRTLKGEERPVEELIEGWKETAKNYQPFELTPEEKKEFEKMILRQKRSKLTEENFQILF